MNFLSTADAHSARLHRRPAYAVNSPAVLCHRCFYFKDPGGGATSTSHWRHNATDALNKVLSDIQMAGRGGSEGLVLTFGLQNSDTSTESPIDRQAADPLRVGPQETILVNLHVLDDKSDDWKGWRARMRVDLHSEYYSVTFILDRHDLKPPSVLARSPETIPTTPKDSDTYVSEWYNRVWERFFALFEAKGARLAFPSEQFFECRGLVLDTMPPEPPCPTPAQFPIVDPRLSKTKRADAKAALEKWIDDKGDLMFWILRLNRSELKDQDANCVLCSVMNGRGVYASSMGRSEAEIRAAKPTPHVRARPERYLLLQHGLPRFQVGRLLRRLHVLDELRCAALFNFKELIAASERIRALGSTIDHRLRGGATELSRDALRGIQKELNGLTSDEKIGGLLFRINRSRYYARSFQVGMKDLLFGRIKGWEPYDAFMNRNLFPTIDHIDAIGVRFEALAARVERLTEERDVAEQINVQSKIAYIQEIGEIIGWTAFAYYAGQILSKGFHLMPHGCAACGIWWLDLCGLTHRLGHELAGMVISSAIAIWAYHHFKSRRIRQEARADTGT